MSGYSPSTLASNIAALICAACFSRERRDEATATFLEEYADFLELSRRILDGHNSGVRLFPGISRHYIRILPESMTIPAAGRSQQRIPQHCEPPA